MGVAFSCLRRPTPRRLNAAGDDLEDSDADARKGGHKSLPAEIPTMETSTPAPESNVLLPLYVYPSPGAWTLLEHTIADYPAVSFTVVINPFNGPGLDHLPDENYRREILKLTCHPNVRVVGYVHTNWAKRDLASVLQDIDRYASWPKHSGEPGMRVTGIFVDETPNGYDAEAEVYLTKLREHVKRMPGGNENVIIHNPGSVPDIAFLKLADSTVIFEGSYHTFQARVAHSIFSATALSLVDRSKLACVIHSIPEDLPAEEWRELGQQARRIAGDVFMSDLHEHYYANFPPKWMDFVGSMAT